MNHDIDKIFIFYENIHTLQNNEINELYIATNDLYNDVCKNDDMKKIYEKIFKNYNPKTIYTIINDPELQNYKNRNEMIDAKKLFFISYCVLLFFKKSYNMQKQEFNNYLITLMNRFNLSKNSKLRKAIEKEIGLTKEKVKNKNTTQPINLSTISRNISTTKINGLETSSTDDETKNDEPFNKNSITKNISDEDIKNNTCYVLLKLKTDWKEDKTNFYIYKSKHIEIINLISTKLTNLISIDDFDNFLKTKKIEIKEDEVYISKLCTDVQNELKKVFYDDDEGKWKKKQINDLAELKIKTPKEFSEKIKKIYDLDNNKQNIEACIYNIAGFSKPKEDKKMNTKENITKDKLILFLKIYYKTDSGPLYKENNNHLIENINNNTEKKITNSDYLFILKKLETFFTETSIKNVLNEMNITITTDENTNNTVQTKKLDNKLQSKFSNLFDKIKK